jgi:hypothetical protein
MGLKGGRNIVVRDTSFRWKFKAHKDNLTRYGNSAQFAHVAIHAADTPGKLIAQVESKLDIPGDNDIQCGATHKARFSPGDVKKLIEAALDNGWDTTSKTQFSAPEGIDLTDYKTH